MVPFEKDPRVIRHEKFYRGLGVKPSADSRPKPDIRNRGPYCILSVGGRVGYLPATQELRAAISKSETTPVKIPGGHWLYQSRIYSSKEDLAADDVHALILETELKKRRRIERAHAYVAGQQARISTRGPIPDDVKTTVWRRDAGQCIKCGGNERLEYDHIIPLALGGSNTVRNIQLLCEPCNRSKGAGLV